MLKNPSKNPGFGSRCGSMTAAIKSVLSCLSTASVIEFSWSFDQKLLQTNRTQTNSGYILTSLAEIKTYEYLLQNAKFCHSENDFFLVRCCCEREWSTKQYHRRYSIVLVFAVIIIIINIYPNYSNCRRKKTHNQILTAKSSDVNEWHFLVIWPESIP